MALIHDIARLASEGIPRDDIAAQLLVGRQTIDWLMDSDSFLVVLEQVGGPASRSDGAETRDEIHSTHDGS